MRHYNHALLPLLKWLVSFSVTLFLHFVVTWHPRHISVPINPIFATQGLGQRLCHFCLSIGGFCAAFPGELLAWSQYWKQPWGVKLILKIWFPTSLRLPTWKSVLFMGSSFRPYCIRSSPTTRISFGLQGFRTKELVSDKTYQPCWIFLSGVYFDLAIALNAISHWFNDSNKSLILMVAFFYYTFHTVIIATWCGVSSVCGFE